MNGILNSPAFREFLQKRCEEILANDEEYQRINEKLLALERQLMLTLPKEIIPIVLEIDSLNHKIIERIPTILHRQFYDNYDKITINFIK